MFGILPGSYGRGQATDEDKGVSIWGTEFDLGKESVGQETATAETARGAHVDARTRPIDVSPAASRQVWDNPIIWREVCTWAYGRKLIAIRVAYVVLIAMAATGLYWTIHSESGMPRGDAAGTVVPAPAWPLVPFFVVSMVIVNALAVTSITGERDGRELDLLLVTDLTPREFIFGKLGGVFWVTKEMVVAPIGLCIYLCQAGGISLENLIYVLGWTGCHEYLCRRSGCSLWHDLREFPYSDWSESGDGFLSVPGCGNLYFDDDSRSVDRSRSNCCRLWRSFWAGG